MAGHPVPVVGNGLMWSKPTRGMSEVLGEQKQQAFSQNQHTEKGRRLLAGTQLKSIQENQRIHEEEVRTSRRAGTVTLESKQVLQSHESRFQEY